MLIFIIPLQSPKSSRDWRLVSRLCERTLRSVCQQQDDDFRVVLACTTPPDIDFQHPALTIVSHDFPELGREYEARMEDKGRKIKLAMSAARQWLPAAIMLTDADDCVSRRLAGHVRAHPEANGWFAETGYIRDRGSRWVMRKRRFHEFCGTSHIVRCTPGDVPVAPDEPDERYWVLSTGHVDMVPFMQRRGTPLEPLPFPGAVYNSDTGENATGFALHLWRSKKVFVQKMLNARPLTSAIREEFGLYDVAA